MQEDPANSNRQ